VTGPPRRRARDIGRPPGSDQEGVGPIVKESSTVFELAVLGLLAEAPMHGYELRKRLTATLGTIRAFSFGSLYPTLRRLEAAGHVSTEDPVVDADAVPLSSRRSRVTYRITAEGKERLADLLGDTGPQSWSDDGFGVHLAFFSRTSAEARMRILEGRRRRVEERREGQRSAVGRAVDRLDTYTAELHQLGLESSDREVRWLNELIDAERGRSPADDSARPPPAPARAPSTGQRSPKASPTGAPVIGGIDPAPIHTQEEPE
jgi:DNA-binding PadR family transcriptional regulator